MESVLTTLYLLFSEGYYSEIDDKVMREELCLEAMRLTYLLIENPQTNLPSANALFSLMCFHSSRFEARKGEAGQMVLYDDQDESKWNQELITKGAFHLNLSSAGDHLTKYHLEAGIAYWHTQKADTREKWEGILHLYNQLLQLEYSPMAALNRTYALSKVKGREAAITEALKLNLITNPFYFLLLGELYSNLDNRKARQYFQSALPFSKSEAGRQAVELKISSLDVDS